MTVRGGPSRTEPLRLDVRARVIGPDGRVVADDDDGEHDGAPSLASRAVFTPEKRGRYLVRVTTAGPWRKYGPYTMGCTPSRDSAR